MVTDLSLREFYNIKEFVNSLPSDRIFEKAFTFDMIEKPELVDDEIRDLTYDSILTNEKKNIAVINGSARSGLANFGARVIRNYGGRVVAANNANQVYEKSLIISDDYELDTVLFLSRVFGIEEIVSKEDARGRVDENEVDRSDILVIFGFDSAEVL